jgi:2-desacetyl-2-hydroxyethyl bacteriochlorophyllide A dehydrogenase
VKALTFQAKQHIAYTDVADPDLLLPTDAIVKVLLTAVCGSDLHVYHARETGLDCGTVMGHEFVGEIVGLGKQVKQLRIGDRVVSPFTTNCGTCYYCRIGLTCRCTQGQLYGWVQGGKGLHGAQAQFVRVPLADSTLLKLDTHISLETALLIGDIRATGWHCAVQAGIAPDKVYAVVGCGPVGLMALIAAREQGANTVFALDTQPERLDLAKLYGGIPLSVEQHNWQEAIWAATDGRGVDAVLEAVGSHSAMLTAYNILRPGGVIASVGVHTSPTFAFSPIACYDKNITLKIGRAPVRHYMPELLAQALQSPFDTAPIITHRLPLSEGANAYQLFDEKREGCIKVVLY